MELTGQILSALVVILVFSLHTLGFVFALSAISKPRTPQGAIGWAVSLVLVPYIAVPFYLMLGSRKFYGFVQARRDRRKTFNQLFDNLQRYNHYKPGMPESVQQQYLCTFEKLGALPLTSKNDTRLLIDGAETFEEIFKAISEAKSYVLVQFYIVKNDEVGTRLKELLIRKAQEGVRVYFLFDAVGSFQLPSIYQRAMEEQGVNCARFHSSKFGRFQINFRNHRKIVIVDGRVGLVGGHNIGDEYLGKSRRFGHWRDTHIRIEGPAVTSLQLTFVEDWYWATNDAPELDWEPKASQGDKNILVFPTGPADDFESCSLFLMQAIQAAQKRVWIASPYFIPDLAVMKSLQLAGLRGVDVRILIPDKADHLLVYMASFAFLNDMEQAGVKVFRYTNGFMHQKVMLVDDHVSVVGTANLDNRSFRLNFEVSVVTFDSGLAAETKEMLEQDFKKSRLSPGDDYNLKPIWFRKGVQLSALFAPIL